MYDGASRLEGLLAQCFTASAHCPLIVMNVTGWELVELPCAVISAYISLVCDVAKRNKKMNKVPNTLGSELVLMRTL